MCVTAVWHWEWAWLSHACQYLFFPGNKANAWEHHACITAGLHQWDPVKAVFIFSVTMLFHSDVNYTASIIWGWTFNLCQGQDATEKVKQAGCSGREGTVLMYREHFGGLQQCWWPLKKASYPDVHHDDHIYQKTNRTSRFCWPYRKVSLALFSLPGNMAVIQGEKKTVWVTEEKP